MDPNPLDEAAEEWLYRSMRRMWQPVAFASEVDPGPVGVRLLDQDLVLVRLGGEVRAFPDLCVHRGTALSLGWVEEDQLRCAYHGWTYGPDGVCTAIPARFGSNIPSRAKLRPIEVAEQSGLIWICLDGDPLFPVPEFPEWEDASFRVIEIPAYEWNCSAARRIENYVDFSHFAWVHDGILGSRDEPEVPDHEVWREGGELRFGEGFFTSPHEESPEEAARRSRDRGGLPDQTGTVLADKSYRMFMPGTVWLNQRLPGNRHYVLYFSVSSIGRKKTRCFTFMARDYDLDEANDAKFVEFNDVVIGQDRPVVESQRPEELPFDLSAELHIRGADRISIEYRRWLVELTKTVMAPAST
jgi:phenylpropionate dioxygenase-like ring-hydroxylating dioxygenase large terminal subunit